MTTFERCCLFVICYLEQVVLLRVFIVIEQQLVIYPELSMDPKTSTKKSSYILLCQKMIFISMETWTRFGSSDAGQK